MRCFETENNTCLVLLSRAFYTDSVGFPLEVDWWGKMAKNYMKITKSTFLGRNSRGDVGRGQANFLGSGGIPSVHLFGENLPSRHLLVQMQ